jgi:hypothetical protein
MVDMPVEQTLNAILKQMWVIDEKVSSAEIISEEERDFYNANLVAIKDYYEKNDIFWSKKKSI